MRILLTILLFAVCSHLATASVAVKGYTKKDGTYVAPHHRSDPNGTKSDNWSTKGQMNPYTGKEGTKDAAPGSQGAVGSGDQSVAAVEKPVGHSKWDLVKPGMSKAEVKALLGNLNMETSTKMVYSGQGTVEFTTQGVTK